MKKLVYISLLSVLFTIKPAWAQVNTDSLKKIWYAKSNHDTTRMRALFNLGWDGYLFSNPDSAFYFGKKLFEFAKTKKDTNYMTSALNLMGGAKYFQGDFKAAQKWQLRQLDLAIKQKNKRAMRSSYGNLSNTLFEFGNYPKAIEYQFKSLRIAEELKDTAGLAFSTYIIGVIYQSEKEYKKSLGYLEMALNYASTAKDENTLAAILLNMGGLNLDFGNRSKAMTYYARALALFKKTNDLRGYAMALDNMSQIYAADKKYEQALDHLKNAIVIQQQIGHLDGVANSLNMRATTKYEMGNYAEAIEDAKKSFDMAKQSGSVKQMEEAGKSLYMSYKKTGRFKDAMEMHELYIKMRDSIANQEAQKSIMVQEFKYAYEKKSLRNKLRSKEEKRTNEALYKRERIQRYLLYGGLVLAFIFGTITFRRFRQTSKQKILIAAQTNLVEIQKIHIEEKQREVIDSIHYARRIQDALMPSVKYMDRNLNRLKEDK
jgi:tetratricopeptide (TPR) repeat protein